MLDPLVQALARYVAGQPGSSPFMTAIEGLGILHSDHAKPPSHLMYGPGLCVVAQGTKWATFGSKRYTYRAGQALVVNLDVPAYGRVAQASPEKPFLGAFVAFDPVVMRSVLEELEEAPQPHGRTAEGWFVMDMDGPIGDCVLRLIRLLDTPKAIPMLYPAITRELSYWLLTGPHGGDIARMVVANGQAQRIIAAIKMLRERFAETIRIEELAKIAHMSPSAFHRQFKALTSMTPVQYQKRLRLLEARGAMLERSLNAETAAFQVGYESPSQFNREYARMFGAPPRRDVLRSL